MVQVTPFLLVLSLALVAPGFSERKSVLEGQWISSVGHILIIGPVDLHGRFSGEYIIDRPYALSGFQCSMNQNSQMLELEFTVYWSADNKTIFKRNSFVNYWGHNILKTSWFLMSHKDNQWIPIRSGTYYFGRLCTCKKDCPGVNFDVDRSTWDAGPISGSNTCFKYRDAASCSTTCF